LALGFLRDDGGGVESVSFELARLDATASSSSVSDELGSFGCEKRLAGGTMTDESAVVDDSGMCIPGLLCKCKESRPEDELVSGTGTPYRARGSARADILGLVTPTFVRAAGVEYGDLGVVWDGGGCDGEPIVIGTNPGGSCPLGRGMNCWLGLPAGPADMSW